MRMKQLLVICVAISMTAGVAYAGSIKIEPASEAQRNIIQAALGKHYPVLRVFAVKSGKHYNAYYVGAVFHATGAGNVTGIWLVLGAKDDPKLVLSVDGGAYQFSGMRRASKTKAYAHSQDTEAKALSKYLSK